MAVQLSSIEGNIQLLDGGAMFGNAPRPVWEKWIAPDAIGRIPLACRSLLIECGGQRILCEAGVGAFFEPKLAERFGIQNPQRHMLRENLASLGISESEIDFVVLSHLHFDHAGGLLPTYEEMQNGQNQLLFPKAKYLVGREAWTRAQTPHARDRGSFVPALNEKLAASGRLMVVEGPSAPGVCSDRLSFFVSNGHTPGQLHTVFRGDQTSVVFAGDLIPGTPWVHLPITMGYDRFPEMLIDEKEKLYSQAVPQRWLVFYTHDPKIAGSFIQKAASGKFEAHDPHADFNRFSI